jgi:subtilisin family serine protease
VAAALARDGNVQYAEPDYIARRAAAPNDPRYGDQWALAKIQIGGAWNVTNGTETTIIAVLDSGIDLTHPDLTPNFWSNPGEIAGNGVDDDSNGFVDDMLGWNFIVGSNDLMDDNGHGTLVAGLAAARTNNSIGIAGVCGNCRLMPVKVMQGSGAANYSDIAAGIYYAANKGAKVINFSLGGYADSQTLRDAVNYAVALNTTLVGGAGNDNLGDAFYPAAYDNVIAVAGTNQSDVKTGFSNYGTWVDVSAPGEAVLTTANGGDYLTSSGTSFSSPIAAGLAGLILSAHPDWTPAMVRAQLIHTADSIDAANPTYAGKLGAGRINATRAIQAPSPILTVGGYSVNGVPNGRPNFGESATLNVSVYNDWADATNVNGTLSTTDPNVTVTSGSASFGNIASGQTGTNSTAFQIAVATAAGYNHAIPFSLALTANGGYATTVNFTVTTQSNQTNFSGTITGDVLWTSDRIYNVTGNLGIAPGATLTIQPGTTIKFTGNFALNIGGTLIADGTSSEPITFMPSTTGGTWNRIYFDDTSTDAVTDGLGNYIRNSTRSVRAPTAYVSGNILRYVSVQGATNGIVCNNATPYLYQVTTDKGGVNCTLGDTPLWLQNSTLAAGVNVTGTLPAYPIPEPLPVNVTIQRNTIRGGGITVNNLGANVYTNTVSGGVKIGTGQFPATRYPAADCVLGHYRVDTFTLTHTRVKAPLT